ncbi:metallophosphoesterase [Streptomyces sp. TS71-3]|uniref:metallophosphoesterase family protein n=1 Tax=Streptomyces sp. TS71-3 TaxID=2733862 RepID=UPI001BB35CD1|nr:metallophosphoesterase [Streptomyces sp. TS71-3]
MPDDLRRPDRAADRLLVAGDLTSEAKPADVARVRELLDGYGRLDHDYFVTRGNHDRPHVGDAYDTCTVLPDATDHHDCRGDVFPTRRQTCSPPGVSSCTRRRSAACAWSVWTQRPWTRPAARSTPGSSTTWSTSCARTATVRRRCSATTR